MHLSVRSYTRIFMGAFDRKHWKNWRERAEYPCHQTSSDFWGRVANGACLIASRFLIGSICEFGWRTNTYGGT